jgi:hypothetical protein
VRRLAAYSGREIREKSQNWRFVEYHSNFRIARNVFKLLKNNEYKIHGRRLLTVTWQNWNISNLPGRQTGAGARRLAQGARILCGDDHDASV